MDQAPIRSREVVVRRVVFGLLYAGILAATVRVGWLEVLLAVFVFCLVMVRGPLVVAGPVAALAFSGVVVTRQAPWQLALFYFGIWLVGWLIDGWLLRGCERNGQPG